MRDDDEDNGVLGFVHDCLLLCCGGGGRWGFRE